MIHNDSMTRNDSKQSTITQEKIWKRFLTTGKRPKKLTTTPNEQINNRQQLTANYSANHNDQRQSVITKK